MIAGATAIVILLVLAAVHVYWAAGGKAGKAAAVPTAQGRAVIKPSALSTAMVAAGLCVIAALLACRIGWLKLRKSPIARRANTAAISQAAICTTILSPASPGTLCRLFQAYPRHEICAPRHAGLFAIMCGARRP